MGIHQKWSIEIGKMQKGPRNTIADVGDVMVGHYTLRTGDVQTGVTSILPHSGNVFQNKVMAAHYVMNGFGKSIGLIQIEELGTIETPILLTNTLSVGVASTALVKYMLAHNEDICDTTGSVNPVVCECNDSELNDIRGLHITEEHVFKAIENCSADVREGAVGAGRGMRCHGLKGGIGSASRQFEIEGQCYTIGALVLTNHGLLEDLVVAGKPVGQKLYKDLPKQAEDKGSIITILATDAPLSERQLKRLCKRVPLGLSKTGSIMANGSGEIAIAFSTANKISHYPHKAVTQLGMLHDTQMDILFRGTVEVVEEAVISSMLHSKGVVGKNGTAAESLANYFESKQIDK